MTETTVVSWIENLLVLSMLLSFLLLLVLIIFILNKCGKNNVLVLLGVALLPFVDERRLRAALEEVYPDLTPEESKNYDILL